MQLQDVENLLSITIVGTPQEPNYQAWLDAAVDWAKEYCNNDFVDNTGAEAIPNGAQMGIALAIKGMKESPNVASQSLGDMSKSFFEGGTFKAAKVYLKPYRRPKAVG